MKQNYQFEKRQREMEKKKKKAEKAQKKAGATGTQPRHTATTATQLNAEESMYYVVSTQQEL